VVNGWVLYHHLALVGLSGRFAEDGLRAQELVKKLLETAHPIRQNFATTAIFFSLGGRFTAVCLMHKNWSKAFRNHSPLSAADSVRYMPFMCSMRVCVGCISVSRALRKSYLGQTPSVWVRRTDTVCLGPSDRHRLSGSVGQTPSVWVRRTDTV
jgi:hypothetical protein